MQRNGLLRFEYGAPNAASSPGMRNLHGVANRVVYVTGASYDNAFVSHPIPRADRTAWFMNMSGADAAHMAGSSGYAAGESLYDTWVRNSSLYPTGGIAIPSPSLISGTYYTASSGLNASKDDNVFEIDHLQGGVFGRFKHYRQILLAMKFHLMLILALFLIKGLMAACPFWVVADSQGFPVTHHRQVFLQVIGEWTEKNMSIMFLAQELPVKHQHRRIR